MGITTELIGADQAGELLERTLKLRNPDLWQRRRTNAAKARARARRSGKQAPYPNTRAWGNYELGLLGLTDLNRPFTDARMKLYAEEMEAGRWYFNPDPIVISEEGYVLNGQHRLAAASFVEWKKVHQVPQFLIVWGVDKRTALLMDEASRNSNDRRTIALGYARAV